MGIAAWLRELGLERCDQALQKVRSIRRSLPGLLLVV
jgi:hypothetical protein